MRTTRNFWKDVLLTSKIPIPEKFFVSPLDRCIHTAKITFEGLDKTFLPKRSRFEIVIKEVCTI